MTFSYTDSHTFTVTHARHIAAKVATDLKRMQRFYGKPTDANIAQYEAEVVALLKSGYLGEVTYGYRRHDDFIRPMLRYTASYLASDGFGNDDPGRILPGADISGARFYSFLTYSSSWDALTQAERDKFKKSLPFFRTGGSEPRVSGVLVFDKSYSSGGRGLTRASIQS